MNKTGAAGRFDYPSFFKSLAVIAIPVAMQNLLTTTGSMVDTVMLARLGERTVGAVGLCAQFSSLMFSSYWGFVGGGTLFMSQFWGAKDDDGLRRSYGVTLTLVMLVGFIFGAAAVLAPGFIMGVYTDKEAISEIGIRYLSVVGFAYPIQCFTVAVSTLLRSTERVKVPLYASIASVFCNCFFNYVLIFGRFGAPRLGVVGAAWGTIIASCVNLAIIVLYAVVNRLPYIFEFGRIFRFSGAFVREYLVKCFPILMNEMAMGVSNMLINIVLGRQTAEAIAAVAIYRTIEGVVISFFSGFSSAASILVGKAVGAGRHEEAYRNAFRIIYFTSLGIAVTGAVIMMLHGPLFTVMGLSGESFEICTFLCGYYLLVAVIRMGNWQQNDVFRAGGDPAFGSIMEITFMYLMVIPLVYICQFVLHAPFKVVFLMVYSDELIRYFIMQRRLYSGKWIRPVSEAGKATIEAFRAEHNIVM